MEVILALAAAVIMALDEGSPGFALILLAVLIAAIVFVCAHVTY